MKEVVSGKLKTLQLQEDSHESVGELEQNAWGKEWCLMSSDFALVMYLSLLFLSTPKAFEHVHLEMQLVLISTMYLAAFTIQFTETYSQVNKHGLVPSFLDWVDNH